MKLPSARNTDIVVQTLGKETLIYDLNTHKAYNLNETSSAVYQACDGQTSFDELKRKHKFTDDLIFLALDQLKEDNLIEDKSFVSPFDGMSRREVIRKVGFASMIALPVIASLVAPTAAMAASGAKADCASCTTSADCASNKCVPNLSQGGNICSSGTSGIALPSGFDVRAIDSASCTSDGKQLCCKGSATFTAPANCICN